MSSNTFRLFKQNGSFINGMFSMLDLSSFSYKFNYTDTDRSVDLEALKADWEEISKDMKIAIEQYEQISK